MFVYKQQCSIVANPKLGPLQFMRADCVDVVSPLVVSDHLRRPEAEV